MLYTDGCILVEGHLPLQTAAWDSCLLGGEEEMSNKDTLHSEGM